MLTTSSQARRGLPAVDTLLRSESFQALLQDFGRPQVLECLRQLLAEQRRRLAVERGTGAPDDETLAAECGERLQSAAAPSIRPVFNLTGTVLHTSLGGALYPQEVLKIVEN